MITLAAAVLFSWATEATRYGNIYTHDSKRCPVPELSQIAYYAELETKDGRIIKGCRWRDHVRRYPYWVNRYTGFQSLDGTVRFITKSEYKPYTIRPFHD